MIKNVKGVIRALPEVLKRKRQNGFPEEVDVRVKM